jgi:AraC-like DNA-binding protein
MIESRKDNHMEILSRSLWEAVKRRYLEATGLDLCVLDSWGEPQTRDTVPIRLPQFRRQCRYAVQESLDLGEASLFSPVAGVTAWVVAMEDSRVLRGGLLSEPVLTCGSISEALDRASGTGVERRKIEEWLSGLKMWSQERVLEAAGSLCETFYIETGWLPEQMRENRLRLMRQDQSRQAAVERSTLYAFEKERRLLANIRAGDKPAAREILNDMLANIYLSSPKLPVLRARTIELISCLTRAAIEDNPLLEPLIERNHQWTEDLIRGNSFEAISAVLMDALDDFMEAIYLHGTNRTNDHVRKALDHVRDHFAEPLNVAKIASAVGLSPSRLQHLVKDCTGRTLVEIIRERRVRRAEHLLQRTSKTCAEIAYETGFCDQSYLVRQFRRLTGTTPAAYRRQRMAVT